MNITNAVLKTLFKDTDLNTIVSADSIITSERIMPDYKKETVKDLVVFTLTDGRVLAIYNKKENTLELVSCKKRIMYTVMSVILEEHFKQKFNISKDD